MGLMRKSIAYLENETVYFGVLNWCVKKLYSQCDR